MAQSVKRPTSSGHDLTVREFEPHVGPCADSSEPASDSVSPLLSAFPPAHALSFNNKCLKGFFFKEPWGSPEKHEKEKQPMILPLISTK